ncbi:MAG: hypothetical protein HY759_03930, partial [Nitrospirae bacterium]|nr:hypothetical protein [Nitrospirota bacterium]
HFAHAYGFEDPNYDGGVLEYSANGGASWNDAGTLFDYNGYDGTIPAGNPLAGRSAFLSDSHGYISSRLNLNSLAGQSVRFRWRMGLNNGVYDWGWWLDDVRIYTCMSCTNTFYRDFDGDGYGNPSDSTQACTQPAGYVTNNTDCDDSNPAVNPGVTEIPNNGIDDDCNAATPVLSASGSGNNYPIPFFRASLSLNVNASSLGTSTFNYYYTRNRLYFVSTSITGISVSGGAATITGSGKVNNVSGYIFTATITDGAADAMGLEIRKSDGTPYYSATSKNLTSGNFTVVGN